MISSLIKKIQDKKAKIAVVGLGRVGLPIAAVFADAGYPVIGSDIKNEVVEAISSGKSHLAEPELAQLIKDSVDKMLLKATTDTFNAVTEADVILICVQTPLTKGNEPNLASLKTTCKTVSKGLSKGKLVLIVSTVPPGTTKHLVARILATGSGLKCGKDFWLAYCPERINPGKAVREFIENNRIIGGFNEESTEIAVELFKSVVMGDIFSTDSQVAEVAKLAENTFRDVNIAFGNELALMCEQMNVDVMEVIKLANTHPRVKIHMPGSGVGGPCLPKDPYLLQHGIKAKGFRFRFIDLAREINDLMPEHTVELVVKALKEAKKSVKNSKIAVLGVAYKGEVGEVANSPAEKIVQRLIALGAKVVVYDPYCNESFGAKMAENVDEAVREADCIVVVTEHKIFEKLQLDRLKELMTKRPVIVDGRRIVKPKETKKQGFVYAGIGFGV